MGTNVLVCYETEIGNKEELIHWTRNRFKLRCDTRFQHVVDQR